MALSHPPASPPHSRPPRITVVGPGAVGATLAGAFAASGAEVCLLGRPGPHLVAIAAQGLLLRGRETGGEVRHRFPTAYDAARLPVPDLAVVCVKSQYLLPAARSMRTWVGRGVDVLVVANGVPWWLPSTVERAGEDPVLRSVDPDGELLRLLPAERVMSGVAHFSSAVDGPGRVTHVSGTRLIIGDPTGGISQRVTQCAAALPAGPVRPEPSADIRRDIWEKLLGNVNLNPVSALTGATVLDILDDPDVRQVCAAVFDETAAVGAALGIESAMTAEERLDIARELGAFRTSMLQDADRGRPLELDALVGAVRELARRTGVPSPSLDAVHGLLALRERVRGSGETAGS
ncbi:ketopantoate reductase family protein [Streptomyces sp. NL15-2K]|uniref:ketopantoate reductase family protein n=1 Tax=Streptomyces sp. NL15-2K TaxID=376149 RepID=UPI000FFA464A|nr:MULTISPECIES: 2-dehydropantoate 2-reductase [Actinomycetes]WKX06209.1 2-dehydropantoate 2-reductase [Kutzneria buriramensis]GCB52932.1 2-dehydropantoate 2-reductase [Streptomyces sp. NL15-2K]